MTKKYTFDSPNVFICLTVFFAFAAGTRTPPPSSTIRWTNSRSTSGKTDARWLTAARPSDYPKFITLLPPPFYCGEFGGQEGEIGRMGGWCCWRACLLMGLRLWRRGDVKHGIKGGRVKQPPAPSVVFRVKISQLSFLRSQWIQAGWGWRWEEPEGRSLYVNDDACCW